MGINIFYHLSNPPSSYLILTINNFILYFISYLSRTTLSTLCPHTAYFIPYLTLYLVLYITLYLYLYLSCGRGSGWM